MYSSSHNIFHDVGVLKSFRENTYLKIKSENTQKKCKVRSFAGVIAVEVEN